MSKPLDSADEGLLAWVERWAPADPSVFDHWRGSLPPELRREALFPLQAALCGLDALRSFENQSLEAGTLDFREYLHAACVTYAWALQLSNDLRAGSAEVGVEPLGSLDALRVSLADAAHVTERLLELPTVDGGSFHSSCDMFLRDLARNEFFRPPRALEISNDPFVALLRMHRLVGVTMHELPERGGDSRALVVLAAVRRDLRELTYFLVSEGNDTVAAELEPALTLLDHDDLLPGSAAWEPDAAREAMRMELQDLRAVLKRAAKRLRGSVEQAERHDDAPRAYSEQVPIDLTSEIWAFRFILRAFLAKAEALPVDLEEALDASALEFVAEFVGHFRIFGPRLAKGTDYRDRGPLTRALSALDSIDPVDAALLEEAVLECERFAEHLEHALSERSDASAEAFDKQRAADELRVYLEAAKQQPIRLREFG